MLSVQLLPCFQKLCALNVSLLCWCTTCCENVLGACREKLITYLEHHVQAAFNIECFFCGDSQEALQKSCPLLA